MRSLHIANDARVSSQAQHGEPMTPLINSAFSEV